MTEASLYAREVGSAETGVLWIHGYTMDHTVFGPLWEALPGMRHVGIDLPGHGQSVGLVGTPLSNLVEKLAALVRVRGLSHVVGLSFGGLFALELALHLGPELRTLLLCSPAVRNGAEDPSAQSCNLELIRQYRARGAGPWLSATWLGWPHDIFTGLRCRPGYDAVRAVVLRHPWLEMANNGLQRMTAHIGTIRDYRSVVARTLLTVGENDIAAFKRNAYLAQRYIPHAQRRYLDGCGHLGLLEDPQMAAQLVVAHHQAGDGHSK